ncbi:uncharacterized protein N7529_010388 [Penicillium soppii]|uniref:uncharacterized protein n=1 Tax=Penicillium soppii TaxID=69789 RepID=UPI002548789E|nr:uncharacterized protein N7529_010388 [Penicillium soppii]KAJ5856444.1 hypothetical protein N7529_010388 [Penicillium soppii]
MFISIATALFVASAIFALRCNEACEPTAIIGLFGLAAWHILCQKIISVDIVDTVIEVAGNETMKKNGLEANVEVTRERIRGELTQPLECEKILMVALQQWIADNPNLKADLRSLKDVAQNLNFQVAQAKSSISRVSRSQLRAECIAAAMQRQYEELRDANPEAEATVIRINKMAAANQALMDADTRNKEVISHLEAQLKAALPLKNQPPPYIANVNSHRGPRPVH